MATKKTATSNVHSTNVVPQTNSTNTAPTTPATPASGPADWLCWLTAGGNTNSALYQSCLIGVSPGVNSLTAPVTGAVSGAAAPVGDLLIRSGLVIAGVILIIVGVVKMFGGNKAINVTLQPPVRQHTFGGAPPPPPPPPPKPLPPMRVNSGAYRNAPGTVGTPRSQTV